MLLGKVVICLQKTETTPTPITLTSINSKWIRDIIIRPKTLRLVHGRAGNTLEARVIGKDFLSRTQAAQQLKRKG
jgi:hypothetical protein